MERALSFANQRKRRAKPLCADVIAKTGATLIHSFENRDVMAGQGTAVVELLEDVPDLDLVMCPIGGGGFALRHGGRCEIDATKHQSDRG